MNIKSFLPRSCLGSCSKYFFLLCFGFFAIPYASQAFETTSQNALVINGTTALYTITYEFGFLNREALLPISAVPKGMTSNADSYLQYEIHSAGEAVGGLTSNAVVLSDAPMKNGRYYIPEGERSKFTLVALVSLSDDVLASITPALALRVSDLPLTLLEDGKGEQKTLAPEYLQDYVTPAITFK